MLDSEKNATEKKIIEEQSVQMKEFSDKEKQAQDFADQLLSLNRMITKGKGAVPQEMIDKLLGDTQQ
jgi:hypothetical protein